MKIQKCLQSSLPTRSSRPRRKITDYSVSGCIARMREDNHVLCSTHSVLDNLRSKIVRDLISDHSYRRVQIFYLIAVAYHNENCVVELDRTISQIGRSTCLHCNAAHHAILPRIKDNFYPLLKERFKANPTDVLLIQKMVRLGLELNSLLQLRTAEEIDRFFHELMDSQRDRLIHKNSLLQLQMDSTIVMPKQVNEYDCILEERMRPEAVKLIQLVSSGLDPYEATQRFVDSMREFYHQSFTSTSNVIDLLRKRNFWLHSILVKKSETLACAKIHEIKLEIQKQRFVRNVRKRADGINILEGDMEIIAQQLAATAVPPRELLDMGMPINQIKALLLRV